jgi:hypothetical protein
MRAAGDGWSSRRSARRASTALQQGEGAAVPGQTGHQLHHRRYNPDLYCEVGKHFDFIWFETDASATVLLSNHSEYDGAYTKARLVSLKREVGPFIVGADGVRRYFTVMAECALASKLRLGAKP